MGTLTLFRKPEHDIGRIYAESRVRETGYVMPAYHCHPYYELFYVERGACRFLIEDTIYDLHDGDFLLVPPQVLHYTRYLFGSCRRNTVFFRQEDVGADVLALMPRADTFLLEKHIFQVPDAYRGQTEDALRRMVTESRINDGRSPLMLTLQLQELLLHCARVCHFLQETPADIHTTDRSIVRAARFVRKYYAQPIRTADIAAAAGLSPNYLTRKFREAAGIGLREYLVFTRLRHAALELVSTGDSITDIALRCGFSDSNYFKDVFKKHFGLTPRAYRKAH